jgi:hypothetical protein
MQELLFEYAVIRVVPRVEREEFINVGVILYCGARKFLQVRYELDTSLLHAISKDTDAAQVAEVLNAFDKVVAGGRQGGTIGMLGVAERFRWLAATRSTMVQTSKVHCGLCPDPGEAMAKIFNEQVNR